MFTHPECNKLNQELQAVSFSSQVIRYSSPEEAGDEKTKFTFCYFPLPTPTHYFSKKIVKELSPKDLQHVTIRFWIFRCNKTDFNLYNTRGPDS